MQFHAQLALPCCAVLALSSVSSAAPLRLSLPAFRPVSRPAPQSVPLTQDVYLKASNTDELDRFGFSMAAFGDRMVVGAPLEDSGATGVNGPGDDNGTSSSGAAYVFRFEAGQWVQEAYIKASNTGEGDEFGFSVALGDDVLVVGAPGEASGGGGATQNSETDSGAAYVFRFTGAGGWSQTNFLKASNAERDDRFGEAVAIDGGWIIVGAAGEDSASGLDPTSNGAVMSGAAYLFRESGSLWTQDAYLKGADPDAGDEFGSAVDVFEDGAGGVYALVGAPFEDSSAVGVDGDPTSNAAPNAGAAFLFERTGTSWNQAGYFKGLNTGAGDQLGASVVMAEFRVAVGAPEEDSSVGGVNPSASNNVLGGAGAAYIFGQSPGGWTQTSYVKASTPGPLDRFGTRLSYAGGRLLVSATGEASTSSGINGDELSNGAQFSGAAYLFETFPFSGLFQTAFVKASNSGPVDSFGSALAITDRWIHVGASREDSAGMGPNAQQSSNASADSGAAYTFRLGDGAFLNYCFAASNSTGTPGRITGTGSGVISANDVVLQASFLPANVFGFFIVGDARGFAMFPGGSQGNLCVGGHIGRFVGPGQVQNSGASGSISLAINAAAIPFALGPVAALPGDEFHFQAWFRDSFLGSPVSNFTNGLTVLFR